MLKMDVMRPSGLQAIYASMVTILSCTSMMTTLRLWASDVFVQE